jgi:hypothetical protein
MIGKCHCGRVVFEVKTVPIRAGRCNCSYCSRRGWLGTKARVADFELRSGRESLRSYRFGAGTTENLFCSECGIHTHFYSTYTDPPHYAYNLACCDGLDLEKLEVVFIDGKSF